ncbi:MAG: class C sortase [Lachnospiraceae bacterium]|nr:class C sortase [Lachnospiraceae bacterium]
MSSQENQDKQRENTRSKRINLRVLLGMLVFLVGLGVVLYPAVSNLWNNYRQSRLTQSYDQAVEAAAPEDLSAMWEAAWEYNANLTGNLIGDAFDGAFEDEAIENTENADTETANATAEADIVAGSENETKYITENETETEEEYVTENATENESETEELPAAEKDTLYQSLLNLAGDGIMGYLSIPKIDVYLPIYHGTGTEELQKGIGHLYGTSLPVGGEGTHTVLAGHRGLPSAALLTDLDLLEEGDYFYFYILDDVLAYQVTGIEVVEPDETDSLATVAGEDLATIVTCTPYGINTHRLLVHGTRVEYVPDMEQEQEQTQTGQILSFHGYAWMAYGLPAIGIAFVLLLALLLRARRKRR